MSARLAWLVWWCWAGFMSLALVFWAFTGMTLWTPTEFTSGRGLVIYMLYIGTLFVSIVRIVRGRAE